MRNVQFTAKTPAKKSHLAVKIVSLNHLYSTVVIYIHSNCDPYVLDTKKISD
jgi:hypothetical protein